MAAAANPATIRALSAQQNAAGLARIALQAALIAGLGALIWAVVRRQGVLAAAPLIAVQGFLIAFLFMAVHETAHRTAFRTRWLNVVVGQACSVAIALPHEYYCLFHWDHHRHTQDPVKDPELVVAARTDTPLRLVLAFTGLPQLAGRIALMLHHAVTGRVAVPWIPADKHRLVVAEARVYTLAYAGLAVLSAGFSSPVLVWTWLAPLLVGQLFLRPYLYSEHTGCGRSRDALENTRTTYTHSLVRWFAWNMPYHAEHHAFPSVPFHALPRLNALVAGRITHTGEGYRRVVPTVWRALRLGEATRGASSESTSVRA